MALKSYEKAKSYTYRLLGYRPRSHAEIINRLKEKGYNSQIRERLASELTAEGLIDDERFARLWLKSRLQTSGRSISFAARELIQKGIDRHIAEEAACEAGKSFDEESSARELLKRRLKAVRGLDRQKAKQRLYGFLRRRGFSSQIIYKLLDEILDEAY